MDPKINFSRNITLTENNGLSMLEIKYSEEPVYEYTEIGWEGTPSELALFILIGGC